MKRIDLCIGIWVVVVMASAGAFALAPKVSLCLLQREAQKASGTPRHAAAVAAYLKKCEEIGCVNELRKEDFPKIGVALPPPASPLALPMASQPTPANVQEESFFVDLAQSQHTIVLTFSAKTGALVAWEFLPGLPGIVPRPY